MKRALFISVLMLFLLVPTNVEAQGAPIGIEIDCDQSTINNNVHLNKINRYLFHALWKTLVPLLKISAGEWCRRKRLSFVLSDDSFEQVAAGEEMPFSAVFAASPRIAVTTEDFTITGRVTSWDMEPVMVPWVRWINRPNCGAVNSLPYSRMDLEVQTHLRVSRLGRGSNNSSLMMDQNRQRSSNC